MAATVSSGDPTAGEEDGDDVENDVEADTGHDVEGGRGLGTAG